MSEEPVVFGRDDHLMGILSRPVTLSAAPVACLMLNVGVTHRIGPHRVNVKLARQLASQGIVSLRFDLSGIGDSPAARTPAHYRAQAIIDLKAAMDHVQALTGIGRFVVFGICSGAINGYALAVEDERVVGLLMFDGYAYPSRRVRWLRNWHRLTAIPGNSAIAGKTMRWLQRIVDHSRASNVDIFADTSASPTADEFAQTLRSLLARGVAVYLVYSGTLHASDNGRDQLAAVRDAEGLADIRYEFMADVDHTVLSIAAQRKLIQSACGWALGVAARVAAAGPLNVFTGNQNASPADAVLSAYVR